MINMCLFSLLLRGLAYLFTSGTRKAPSVGLTGIANSTSPPQAPTQVLSLASVLALVPAMLAVITLYGCNARSSVSG